MIEKRDDKESYHPRLFAHKQLKESFAAGIRIDRKKLVNILNHMHFKGENLNILLRDPSGQEEILLNASFQPCLGETVVLTPDKKILSKYISEQYQLKYLLLPFDQAIIYVPKEKVETLNEDLVFSLPDTSFLVNARQTPRFQGCEISADLWQNGFQAVGQLIDFNHHTFRIRVQTAPPSSFRWFNVAIPSQIRLYDGDTILYSGNCKPLYEIHDGQFREIVFSPVDNTIQRFIPKAMRNPRLVNLSVIHVIFQHPFTKKEIQHTVVDMSTSGFSLLDQLSEIVLFPGMIIPRMAITIAGILDLQCKAQVIHRSEDSDGVRFGMAVLDMDITSYKKLFQILTSVNDPEGTMFNRVNLDDLWEFFFDTGFIYPSKYSLIQTFKDDFRDIYRKLYEESPDIANHFVYQKNGHIYGHISMLRSYEKTWMIHHLAARPIGGRTVGMDILKQLLYYLNDVKQLPSANVDYVITYFRPENKFPARIFGGFYEYHGNSHHCSLDVFAYMTYPGKRPVTELPAEWYVKEWPDADSLEFEQFNRRHSDGLFPSIVRRQTAIAVASLQDKYTEAGFTRDWKFFTLHQSDHIMAFIIDERSDIGLNMSNLLSGIKIFVADEDIDPEILFASVSRIREFKTDESFSLMVYPAEYAYKNKMNPKMKDYALWILDMQYGSEFIDYLGRQFRIRL
jgi:hypothetical protein